MGRDQLWENGLYTKGGIIQLESDKWMSMKLHPLPVGDVTTNIICFPSGTWKGAQGILNISLDNHTA
jgi:hypothetical protein